MLNAHVDIIVTQYPIQRVLHLSKHFRPHSLIVKNVPDRHVGSPSLRKTLGQTKADRVVALDSHVKGKDGQAVPLM